MDSEDGLKEIDIKTCKCYYFDNIIRVWYTKIYVVISFISLHGKLCNEDILNYKISYKISRGEKPQPIRFDKIGAFIKFHDKVRYLVLFDYSYSDEICDKIKYIISEKSGITDSINHSFARMRIDSYDSLTIEKIFTFLNVIILFKSFVNKIENNYYGNVFSEKASNKDKPYT